eukprot:822103-Prymnesium_polylepis.1
MTRELADAMPMDEPWATSSESRFVGMCREGHGGIAPQPDAGECSGGDKEKRGADGSDCPPFSGMLRLLIGTS